MVRAKNYEITSTFVKVMQKKLWPLFSGHGVYPHGGWIFAVVSVLCSVQGEVQMWLKNFGLQV